jgi:hypothetical protein
MNRIFLFSFFLVISIYGSSQTINSDPTQSYINIDLPRTPESQGFEKYGNFAVSELTGSANISVPLYDLKTRFLDVPISLSYQPGIKVSQEASWVGLGWDLNVGGRITVETRGAIDNDITSDGHISPTILQTGMQQIFDRLGDSSNLGILTYACTCFGCYQNPSAPHAPGTPDDWGSVNAMAQFGLGEPDIFRANFMGHSLSFYFDKLTGQLSFLGEKSLFNIQFTKPANSFIQNWTITDNLGNQYFFNQQESTSISLTTNATLFGSTAISAWLLTKIVHPSGDSVVFSYTTFGDSYPAFNWNASLSETAPYTSGGSPTFGVPTASQINDQNAVTQHPYYLTKIETNNVAVNFKLGSRTDLNGSGSKRLDSITVVDKVSNTIKKKVSFGYNYFIANVSGCYVQPSTDANNRNNPNRLKLTSLNINDMNGLNPPYQFFYSGGYVPSKFSFNQDHWGYFNTTGGYAVCDPQYLLPYWGTGVTYPAMPSSYMVGHANRDCDPFLMTTMSLDSIIYPTGGSSSFVFEPHQSARGTGVTGGGLRIKTIRNYSLGKLAGSTDYSYSGGVYMGNIEYVNSTSKVQACQPGVPGDPQDEETDVLSTNGAVNDNDYLVGYPSVAITQNDGNGRTNGYTLKTFNVCAPAYTNGNTGFNTALPVWPYGIQGTTDWDALNSASIYYLYAQWSGYAPTPIKQLDGKLMQEQTFDASGNLLKSVNHYYHQIGYSQKFYDIKVRDNTIGSTSHCGAPSDFSFSNGARRFSIFVSPAKSFFTLEDSVIELMYNGSNFIKNKKAFQYNSYYQPQYETMYNSDGTQTIAYTQTTASLTPNYSLAPEGDALLLQATKNAHIYDLPVEQTTIHRGTAGDSTIIASKINIYNLSLPLKVYVAETVTPLTFRSQFVPAYYTYTNYPNSPGDDWDSLKQDSHYKLYSTADYSTNNQIKTIHTLQGNSTYIWDENYNTILAQCSNTDSLNAAFTSFETSATGHWTYSQGAVAADPTSPTGVSAFTLASGVSVVANGLTSSNNYVVSYWSKTGASYTVTGSSSVKQGKTINGWTYFEHTVTGTTSVTISGSGKIDEVRLYPSTSQMISYTYSPLIGISSQCDADNRITYYFYDSIGRLQWIKDQDGNIIKTIQYHFQGISGAQY